MRTLILLLLSTLTLVSAPLKLNIAENDFLKPTDSFTIAVDKPIFPTDTTYSLLPLMKCSEKIDVIYKINSATNMEVIPRERWHAGKVHSCTLDTSMLTVTNETEAYDFTFTTKEIGLESYAYFKDDKMVRLTFNDKVKSDSLKQRLKFIKKNKFAQTQLQYEVKTEDSRIFLVTIKENVGDALDLVIEPGVESLAGSISIVETLHSISTKKEVQINPSSGTLGVHSNIQIKESKGIFGVTIAFGKEIDEKDLKSYIDIDNIKNFDVKKDYDYWDNYRYKLIISSKEFKPSQTHTVTLRKGLKALAHDSVLKEDESFSFTFPDFKERVIFTSDKKYISNLGEIGLETTNLEKATFTISKVTDDNYRYMTNITDASSVNKSLTKVIYAKDVKLDNPPNVQQKQKIRLKDLEGKLSYGMYNIEVIYTRGDSTKTVNKDIYVSDIGIAANYAKEQLFVSLVSLSNAKPIAGATVDLYTNHNILVGTVVSNEDGIAVLSPNSQTYGQLGSIIASTADDKNFLALQNTNIINGIRPNDMVAKEAKYRAHVYFQSKIVRPGALVHGLITVKDKNFISADTLPLKLELVSRAGGSYDTIDKSVMKTDSFGLIDYQFQMDNSHRTGLYVLHVYLGDEYIGSEEFNVEAFMPPKIENELTTDKAYYSTSDVVKIEVKSKYLHGMPASGLKGKLTVHAIDKLYKNAHYAKYSFINQELEKTNETSYLSIEQDIALNEEGLKEVILPLQIQQKVPSIIEAMIGATIMDDGQPVSKYKTIDIYPYDAMVGVKIDNDSIKTGTALEGSTVLLDPITNKPLDRELTVVVKRKDWFYNYVNGRYNWDYHDEVVERFSVRSNTNFSKNIDAYGSYVMEIHDRLGGHSSSVDFGVSGWDYQNVSPDKSIKKVDISFENKSYKVGDTVSVTLNSPIPEGTMLLTLEGDRVYWYETVQYKNGKATIDVPLGEALKYGLYLHATAIRGTAKASVLTPFRATGYAYLKKDRSMHSIDVKLDHEPVTSSKSKLRVNVKTDKDATLLVSVVDKGILNILEQKSPKLFEFFNTKEKQKIMYLDLYDNLMHHLVEGKILSFGSGDEGSELNAKRKKHLPPDNSDRVKPFMLWSGLMHTNNKSLSVDLKIPEFNGEAIVVVMAVNKDAVGVGNSSFIVKDDLMIKPALPRFILLGDAMQIPIRVFNTTDIEKHITLENDISTHMTLAYEKQITLAPKSSKVIFAQLKSKEEGKGHVSFAIEDNGKRYTKRVDLLTMNPYALQTKVFAGATGVIDEITVPENFVGGTVTTTLSNNILGKLRGDLKYLVQYPYGCAEQISSKISALYYSLPFLTDDILLKDAKIFIQSGMDDVIDRQTYKGEISYWSKDGYVDKEASLYASDTLLMLSRHGYELNKNKKSLIIYNLKRIAKGEYKGYVSGYRGAYTPAQRLYAAFILSENGSLETSTANMMYNKLLKDADDLSKAYMASMYFNLGEKTLANKLYPMAKRKEIIKRFSTQSRPFSTDASDAATFLYLNAKYFEKDGNNYLDFNRYLKNIYSTYDKAAAIKALNTYAGKEVTKKMKVRVSINDEEETYTKNTTYDQPLKTGTIKLYPLSGVVNYNVEVYKHLPYALKNRLTYNDLFFYNENQKKDSSWTGIGIKREFIDKDGKEVNLKNLQQGDKIFSKLTINNFDALDNVVVSQRFPACMDIVNDRISKGKHPTFNNDSLSLDYQDIRDDRVLYFFSLEEGKVQYTKNDRQIQSRSTIIYTSLIVTTQGEFKLPAVTIEAMYNPRVNDYAKEVDTVIVGNTKNSVQKMLIHEPILIMQNELTPEGRKYIYEYSLDFKKKNPNPKPEKVATVVKNLITKMQNMKPEQCELSMTLDGKIADTSCVQLTNSKQVKILCTKTKKMCKTLKEVRDALTSNKDKNIKLVY